MATADVKSSSNEVLGNEGLSDETLTLEELHEIDEEVKKFPYKESACLEALFVVQHKRGWVSDAMLKAVAKHLDMSETELDSIATFYNLIYRKPVGKHVVRVCDSVSCWIMGYDKVKSKICRELGVGLGETTSDKCFTVLPAQCLGACDKAPTLMVNDDLHHNLNEDNVVQILRSYREK